MMLCVVLDDAPLIATFEERGANVNHSSLQVQIRMGANAGAGSKRAL